MTKDEIFVFGEYRLDVRERRLWQGNAVVALSPKTFDLLVVMLQGAGRLLGKDYLIRSVWPDSYVQDANLSVHIANIRKILGKTSAVDQFIETVPKVGYRFVVPVSCLLYTESPPRQGIVDDASPSVPTKEQLPPETVSPSAQVAPSSSRASTRKGRDFRNLLLLVLFAIVIGVYVLAIRLSGAKKESMAENSTSTRPLSSTSGLFLLPAFSPDGQELAYTWRANTNSHQSIYLQHVSSDDRRILIDTGGDDYSPSWSPHGSEIAFLHSLGDDQPLEIQLVEKQNPAIRRSVATICGANDVFRNTPTLSWSPDARTLVTTDCGSKK